MILFNCGYFKKKIINTIFLKPYDLTITVSCKIKNIILKSPTSGTPRRSNVGYLLFNHPDNIFETRG